MNSAQSVQLPVRTVPPQDAHAATCAGSSRHSPPQQQTDTSCSGWQQQSKRSMRKSMHQSDSVKMVALAFTMPPNFLISGDPL